MPESEPTDDSDAEPDTATVSEDKFNGTATLQIKAENERHAEAAARRFFKEVHGCKPTKTVVSEDEHRRVLEGGQRHFEVIVTDHSSGSLTNPVSYTFD